MFLKWFPQLNLCCHKKFISHASREKNYYLSYKKFDDETFINDVQNIPFSVCDVFDDVDDRLWSFNKLFSDVIDKNAPIKKSIIKKPSLPYINDAFKNASFTMI